MTNEQINAAIAEACGWTNVSGKAGRAPNADYVGSEFIPNYCGDLNAMHEAEKVLTDAQCVFFRTYLREQFGPHPASLYVWHATARQRAEAFLRTVGKWEEVKQ